MVAALTPNLVFCFGPNLRFWTYVQYRAKLNKNELSWCFVSKSLKYNFGKPISTAGFLLAEE